MVSVLSSSVQYISEEFIRNDVIEMLLKMLKDEVIDVKLMAIRQFHHFFPYLEPSVIRERIVSEYKVLVADKNWKIRFEVLKSAPHLLELGSTELTDDFTSINDTLRDDHIACIREHLIQNLVDSYRGSSIPKLDAEVSNLVHYWAGCNNYIFRISCLQLLARFVGVLTIGVFHQLLTFAVDRLKSDRVHNVRLNVLKLLLDMIDKTDADFKAQFVRPLLADFEGDKDPDIAYTFELIKEKLAAC